MRFGEVLLERAEGAILAHSLRAGGVSFKKGRALSAEDVRALARAGIESVVAAVIEAGDAHEDAAAAAVAAAVCGPGVEASAAFTGRVNLFAAVSGVLVLDAARLDAVNRVDEAVTIATLPPFAVVETGQMVATVKIIPFAVAGSVVAGCRAAVAGAAPPLAVAAFRPLSAGLVLTRLPGMKESVLDKTAEATRVRIAALGGTLAIVDRVDHDTGAVADAVARIVAAGCGLVLVSGASAIIDRADVVPAAVARAGGRVVHFGMPVDPGNLVMVARLGEVPVIGLPGCARSPKLNGFDWILERLAAGLDVAPADIMGMGVGGLLKDVERPLPRAQAAPPPKRTVPSRAPAVAAVVLAAGRSSRMGGANKLVMDAGGQPLIARVVDHVLASKARPVIVVTGHERAKVEAALEGRAVVLVHCATAARGLSESMRAGLAAVPAAADAAVVCLGDMPLLKATHVDRLIAAFDPLEGRAICVPVFDGRRGNPVLWGRRFFAEMAAVQGDVGAKHLVGEHADLVAEVAMPDDGVLVDLDSPEAWRAVAGRLAEAG